MTIQYTGNNLKFQMLIIHSSNKLWTKGYGWNQSEDQIPYTTHNFCVPKKQGQGLHIVQDFRELNNHTHIDKYSMKEIHKSNALEKLIEQTLQCFQHWILPADSGRCHWTTKIMNRTTLPFWWRQLQQFGALTHSINT